MWRELSPRSRRPYYLQSEKDKARYLREMSTYKPSKGFTKKKPRLKSISSRSSARKREFGTRLRKHKDAPRRPRSAYMCFVKSERNKFKIKNPNLSFVELGVEMGKKWRLMDDDARKPYNTASLADKQRYIKEKKIYVTKMTKTTNDDFVSTTDKSIAKNDHVDQFLAAISNEIKSNKAIDSSLSIPSIPPKKSTTFYEDDSSSLPS